ncbi:unnamed protein product, partial [Pelagomonas calceolata]
AAGRAWGRAGRCPSPLLHEQRSTTTRARYIDAGALDARRGVGAAMTAMRLPGGRACDQCLRWCSGQRDALMKRLLHAQHAYRHRVCSQKVGATTSKT